MTITQAGTGSTPGGTSEKRGMNLTLRIWRQKGPSVKGKMVTYKVSESPRTCRSSRCSTCSTSG